MQTVKLKKAAPAPAPVPAPAEEAEAQHAAEDGDHCHDDEVIPAAADRATSYGEVVE